MSDERQVMRRVGAPFDNECCADMVKAKSDISDLERRADVFDDFIKEMREAMTYRLPLWATIAIASLSAAVAWFAK